MFLRGIQKIFWSRCALHFAVMLLTVLLSGCVSDTIASRILQRQALFDTYDEPTQTRLKQGKIQIGDDPDAVWFVYGSPSQRLRRTEAHGTTETWIYKILGYSDRLNHGVRPVYQDVGGRLRGSYYFEDTPEYEWKEVLRIEFVNGCVNAVQYTE